MGTGCALGDVQIASDDGQRASVGQKHDDLALARSEPEVAGHGGAVPLNAIRRGGTFGLIARRGTVSCLRFAENAAFGRARCPAFRVPFAAGKLRHSSLGQDEERYDHQAQDGGHGHDVGLHVSAGHQGV